MQQDTRLAEREAAVKAQIEFGKLELDRERVQLERIKVGLDHERAQAEAEYKRATAKQGMGDSNGAAPE
jgi:hypothetical protein